MNSRSEHKAAGRVLLVGWDGADWKVAGPLLRAGELPQLAAMVKGGASGPLSSLPPYLSPMLWNSIATGKYADKHGILGFTTTDPATGKLIPVTSTQRACKAVWNILSEHGLTAHVIGWFASHPAENLTGVCVSEAFPRPASPGEAWPVPVGSVHPPELAEALGELRLAPEQVDADVLRLFVPRLAEIDQSKDERPQVLATRLAELYSVHNAAIAALDRGPAHFLGVYYHFIDWICHDFMDFHPPRRPGVSEREFELYKDVVASAYRLQDLLLRDLLAHAGPDSTVVLCSDHGFHSDERRPERVPMVSAGVAIWHRAQGLFAAAGPGVAPGVEVRGATVLDLTPTLLALLGLPAAEDMDGRVLGEALADPARARPPIPSYETAVAPAPRPRHLGVLGEADQDALLKQFAALGYVDLGVSAAGDTPAARGERDNRWNLAITLRHAGRHERALEELQKLHMERPEDPRYAYHYAACAQHLGLTEEARLAEQVLLDYTPGVAPAHRLLAELALARRDTDAALAHLDALATGGRGGDSAVRALRGQALLQKGLTGEACEELRAAVAADVENPGAHQALAGGLLKAGLAEEAAKAARAATELEPALAVAHLILGQALAALGARDEAVASLERARALNPRLAAADRSLDLLAGRPYVAGALDLTAATVAAHERAGLARRCEERRRNHVVAGGAPDIPLPVRRTAGGGAQKPVFIVSGLPRTGTSVMMQVLARGGLRPLADGRRAADIDNPEGYLEWEDAKLLPADPGLVAEAAGRVVKIVSPLLVYLPGGYKYKVVFMRRPASEIARSQEKMRLRLDPAAAPGDADELARRLAQHEAGALRGLRERPDIELLEVDYPSLVAEPERQCERVAAFVGRDWLPRAGEMAGAVRPELHRQRVSSVERP